MKTRISKLIKLLYKIKIFFFFFFWIMKFFRAWCTQLNCVVSVHYSYLGVPYFQFWTLKHNLGMTYTGRSTAFKKRAIARAWAKNVPCVSAYIKILQEVRQLCMNYTQHKYLINWTIRKKDTHVQSQENLGGELWTLSLKLEIHIKTFQ